MDEALSTANTSADESSCALTAPRVKIASNNILTNIILFNFIKISPKKFKIILKKYQA